MASKYKDRQRSLPSFDEVEQVDILSVTCVTSAFSLDFDCTLLVFYTQKK
jgi:hypothetical protein